MALLVAAAISVALAETCGDYTCTHGGVSPTPSAPCSPSCTDFLCTCPTMCSEYSCLADGHVIDSSYAQNDCSTLNDGKCTDITCGCSDSSVPPSPPGGGSPEIPEMPPPSPPPSPESEDEDKGKGNDNKLSDGAIAGIAVGGAAAGTLAVALILKQCGFASLNVCKKDFNWQFIKVKPSGTKMDTSYASFL